MWGDGGLWFCKWLRDVLKVRRIRNWEVIVMMIGKIYLVFYIVLVFKF